MTFQVSNAKGHNFMNLLNKNSNPIKLYAAKDSPWLKFYGHFNSLYIRATRAIINHTPIGKYQLRFFLWEEFKCLCSLYSIESKHHILYKYKHFNNYWNLNRESITHFTLFLEFNSSAFSFGDNTTQSDYKYSFFYSLFIYFFLSYFSFSHFSFSHSLCSMCINIYSYKVAIIVCLLTSCNKLLILKKDNIFYIYTYYIKYQSQNKNGSQCLRKSFFL